MRIAIFGAGGVGGYFGGRLAQAGEDIVFIARGDHLKAMLTDGLRVDSVKGDFVVKPVQAADDPEQVGVVDVIILGVKTWQVNDAAQAMRPMVGPETVVLPLQNGVETPAHLAAVLGNQHVLGGLCALISFIVGPGHIRHAGFEPFVRLGELDNHVSERVQRLHEAFATAGVSVEIPPDIHAALWEKLLNVGPFGSLGAVSRAPIGVLMELPETRKLMEQGMREIYEVARTRNIALSEGIVDKAMAVLDKVPASGTSSLQRDIIAGKPSELDAWTGSVVRLGKEVGVATPLHSFIYYSLLPMEIRARGQVEFQE
ncbi:MAG: 2-dehydropantoate 2-reductase [Desulfobacterales bacterium]|nr:MAG: 2-dehydropantoate 2-reductase [Desulfobacterales bacterium]